MSLFVDTSVWSLALRRDAPADLPAVGELAQALERGAPVVTTGLVIQELLQGFHGPKAKQRIIKQLSLLPAVMPELRDHIDAASLRNDCRRHGIQIGTIDALIAQLCIHYELTLLATDGDFEHVARRTALKLWRPGSSG